MLLPGEVTATAWLSTCDVISSTSKYRLIHGNECIVWLKKTRVCLSRLRDRDGRPAAREFVRDAQSAVRLPESRSRRVGRLERIA